MLVGWCTLLHRLFLLGLKKYGKGDWRNISRNFVVTRTPTQVASHAQKYFIRQLSGGKDKRRASIHDITTVNLSETSITATTTTTSSSPCPPTSEDHNNNINRSCHSKHDPNLLHQWNHPRVVSMGFNPYGVTPYAQNLHTSALQEPSSYLLGAQAQNMVFQMQSSQHFSHA